MKKNLKELIEMAERGKKFEATHNKVTSWFNSTDFKLVDSWTVRMKREPRVIWTNEYDHDRTYFLTKEQADFDAENYNYTVKANKFIEVIEDEDNT